MIFPTNRWLILLQIALFAVLIAMAVVFFRERLLVDSGYYLLRMINHGWPWVEHQRYILVLSQILPWLGVVFHLPMKVILLLYSLNHVLFPLLVFYLTVKIYNKPIAGFVLLMFQVTSLITGFFVPMFELYYAGSLLVLFVSALYSNKSLTSNLVLFISGFFIISSHPIGIVLLFMVMVIHFLKHKWEKVTIYGVIVTITLAMLLLKYFNASEYESGKTAAIISGFSEGKYSLTWLGGMIGFVFSNYLPVLIIATGIWVAMIINKSAKEAFVYFVFFMIIFFLSALNTGTLQISRYNEQVWFPLSVIALMPLLTTKFSVRIEKLKPLLMVVFVLFFAFRVNLIREEGNRYSQRNEILMKLISQAGEMNGQHFVVDEKELEIENVPDPNWSFPIESLLFSSESGPDSALTICTTEDYYFNDVYRELNGSNYLFWRIGTELHSGLNEKYFRLQNGTYQQLMPGGDMIKESE
ncbi:MAG: hypothetical protein CVT94_05305 [Bacteroidetes bacterium HGW-Bacteroidetes-11]|jgi:hypothetical protein|nr:MAG: hypothetical protein CVT94_05305 [Bacteroidetes bacterium HGW-Bacteroidetes-11]